MKTDKEQSGHRQRLRERFLRDENGSHSDEALLELILTYAISRKDVKPLAQELIQQFGSLEKVLSATLTELDEVKGLGQSSIVLLKALKFIRSNSYTSETSSVHNLEYAEKKQATEIPQNKPEVISKPQSSTLKKSSTEKQIIQRKFQVSNGYLLEFDQLSRVLNFMYENRISKKISRKLLQDHTGLAERHVESLVSMGAAMGLIRPGIQILSPIGLLVCKYDIFIERIGTLQWCHYVGAGTFKNLIWFEIFNQVLNEGSVLNQELIHERLRSEIATQYSERTIKTRIPQEVRFVIDAYLNRNFSKLELINQTSDDKLFLRRYSNFEPMILAAMIYDFFAYKQVQLFQVDEFFTTPGSPAILFGLDAAGLRQNVEELHDHGWLRYETTHNLDQIRLKPKLSAIEFLSAYYENREPREISQAASGDLFK